jgi:tetratricopeptide (TPR) repeat protein
MKYLTITILLIISYCYFNNPHQAFSSVLYFPDLEEKYSLLESKLDTITIDSNRVKVYLELSRLLNDTIPKKSIDYAQKGIDLSNNINWSRGEIDSYFALAACYSNYYEDHYKAIEICKKALKISIDSKDSIQYGKSHILIGIYNLEILKSSDDDVLEELVSNLLKAKNIFSELDMPFFVGLSDKFLHKAYKEIDDYKTALKYYESYRFKDRLTLQIEHEKEVEKLREEHKKDIKELKEKHKEDIAQIKIESFKQGGNIISYLSVAVFILLLVIIYQLFKIKKLRKVQTVLEDNEGKS